MIAAEKKAPGFIKEPENISNQKHYSINPSEDDKIHEPDPASSPEGLSKQWIIPLNKHTKYFYEQLTGVEIEMPEREIKNTTCPECLRVLKACSLYLDGEWEDYYECQCGYTTKKKLLSEMTPDEVLDMIEAGEVPYENSEIELEAA